MEEYSFEKLAREIVLSRLKNAEKAPQEAADTAKKIIIDGVTSTKGRQDPHLTVSGVCRGVMSGVLLNDQSLPETAVFLLGEMADVAQEVQLDPADLMTWGMEGIADVAVMASANAASSIQEQIEQRFMGVGEIFSQICRKASEKPQQPV